MLNYFYALIAMSCLYGSFWGMRNTTEIQADLSALGARRSIAPTHKLKAVSSDILAALVIHFSEILITVGYIAFVLGGFRRTLGLCRFDLSGRLLHSAFRSEPLSVPPSERAKLQTSILLASQ